MPIEKQSLNNFLPNGFETLNQEGYKENFSEDKIKTGYEKDIPDIVSGPNLNNLIDVVGKNTNILSKFLDFIKSMPINSILKINNNNEIDYQEIGDIDNKVSKSGDTMTGNLAIKNNYPFVTLIDNDFDRSQTGALEANKTLSYFRMQDKNNLDFSAYTTIYSRGGNLFTSMKTIRSVEGVAKTGEIGVGVRENGGIYTVAPTPATEDNSTQIATTAWVNNSKNTISSWAFPSTKYANLTLGASGSTYTAPANGWYFLMKHATKTIQYHSLDNTTARFSIAGTPNFVGAGAEIYIPAKKGDVIKVNYTTDGDTVIFRFIYAEGEK